MSKIKKFLDKNYDIFIIGIITLMLGKMGYNLLLKQHYSLGIIILISFFISLTILLEIYLSKGLEKYADIAIKNYDLNENKNGK